jgi:Polyketide cyclase / dehydrase and lipid transport
MKPVTVTIDVPQSREAVYDFLDVMSNHEQFTDHIMQDWQFEGPARGIGSKARVKAVAAGRTETVEIEVIEAERPVKTVERNVGAGGKRVGTGTYTLADLPDGGTRVTFTYAWQQAPWNERLAEPVVRGIARRGFERAMPRLAERLRSPTAGDAGA